MKPFDTWVASGSPTSDSQVAPDLSAGRGRRELLRRAVRWGLMGGLAYLLLCTFVWDLLCGLAIGLVFEAVHLGTPEDQRPAFREYLVRQSVIRTMCDFGNAVADITRPLTSDEAMIAHWQAHRQEWEAAATDPQGTPAKLSGLEKIEFSPPGHAERFATLIPGPALGRNRAALRPCTGRSGSAKGYLYFPEQPPTILDNRIVLRSGLDYARENQLEPRGALLVANTDRPHYTDAMRALSPSWYLVRWE